MDSPSTPLSPSTTIKRETARDLLSSFQPSKIPRTPQRGQIRFLPLTPDFTKRPHEDGLLEVSSSNGYHWNFESTAGPNCSRELPLENEKLNQGLQSLPSSYPESGIVSSALTPLSSTNAQDPATAPSSASITNVGSATPSTPGPKVKAQQPLQHDTTDDKYLSARSLRARPSNRVPFNFSKSTYSLHSPPSVRKLSLKLLLPAVKAKVDQKAERTTGVALSNQLRRDEFYLSNQNYFLPLLPKKNYISRLQATRSSVPVPTQSFTDLSPAIEQPKEILTAMKDYQLVGLQFLVRLTQTAMAGILADEMGLGKTIQTLALLAYLKRNRSTQQKPSLVLCPLSVLSGWVAEVKLHAPNLRVLTLHGPPKERKRIKERLRRSVVDPSSSERFDIVVINYETYEIEISWMTRQSWDCVILDEGHKIKNASSKISKSLRTIRSNLRLLLTGTPVQNDLKELWALFHWLFAEVFVDGTDEIFARSFDLTCGSYDESNMVAASKLLNLVMLRRTKQSPEVDLRLPGLTESRICVPLTDLQKTWYLRLITKAKDYERDGEDKAEKTLISQTNARNPSSGPTNAWSRLMNLLMQLRQVCIHPYLIDDAVPLEYYPFDHVIPASSKFLVVQKLVDEIVVRQHKKLIIFSGFTGVLDRLEELLHLQGGDGSSFKYLRLDGQTAVARRNLNIRLFQDRGSDYQVFLISTRAGGHGLNLQAASDMIFMDEDWNPQITQQAKARCYRIGQDRPVNIYQIVTEGTVEAQMSGRILKKLYLSAKITDAVHEPNVYTGEKDSTTPQLGLADLRAMINGGTVGLSHSAIDVSEISKWDVATILDRCVIKPEVFLARADEDAEVVSATEWFSSSEKIHTRAFEGQTYQRPKAAKEQSLEILDRADRRIGKNTTVMVDGWCVSKESVGCKEWEAVPTLASTHPVKEKQTKKADLKHQKTCQTCHTRGKLLSCARCPRAYHVSCLSEQPVARTPMGWACPQHKCGGCGKSANDAGGLLYRCATCEKAYCEACLSWEKSKLISDALPELEALNFYAENNAFYVYCMDCNKKESVKTSKTFHRLTTPALSFSGTLQPQSKRPPVEKTLLKRKLPVKDDDDILEISPAQWHNKIQKIQAD